MSQQLTSPIERVRREAEAEALQASQAELAKQLQRLDEQREEAQRAARERELEIHQTTLRVAREVRAKLAAEVYAAFTPLVRAWLDEPKRQTARSFIATFQAFKGRCAEETGRELEARAISNIMIGELGPGVEPQVAHAAWAMPGGYSNVANIEGALAHALREGIEVSMVEKQLDAMESAIAKLARDHAPSEPSEKFTKKWEASRTALCSADHARSLAELAPPVVVPSVRPGFGGIPIDSENDGYKPSLLGFLRGRSKGSPGDAA